MITRTHYFLCVVTLMVGEGLLIAQLPTARLWTIFPPGGQVGSTCEVAVAGVDLDDASGIWFSHPNITAAVQTNGAGKFAATIETNVPPGIYDARVIGRFGISNPRAFVVGTANEVIETENDSWNKAMAVSPGMTVNGRAEANAIHYFKVGATNGQPMAITCDAATIDSRMDPSMILYDSHGRELKQSRRGGLLEFTAAQDGQYVLKVHDFLFGGGNEHFYRLSIRTNDGAAQLAAPEESETVKPPCEVAGSFYPAGDVDSYTFDAKKGDVWWVEVFSHRLGLPTDPLLLINDQEFNDSDANVGGVEFKTSSLDPAGRFEAKEDGPCRIQVRDTFNRVVSDPRRAYRLEIRKETPDFQVFALPQGPPPKKDTRETFAWTSVLRRGETIPVKIIALRRDGFKGEIAVSAAGLPTGCSSSELLIPGDKNSGILLVTAMETATNWNGTISVVGKATVGTRMAKAATLIWNVSDFNTEPVRSRTTEGFALAICDEAAPISIETAEPKTYEVPASGKLAIPLKVVRRGEFTDGFRMKAAGLAPLDSLKEIEIAEKGTNATIELDLTQQKLSPGAYAFYLQGQARGKYRNPAEGEKDKPKDVTIIVYSAPIGLKVAPPQTAAK